MNNQKLKLNYGMHHNSATGAMGGDEYHFGSYGPHLENFKKRWGWDYETIVEDFELIKENYKGTLIYDFYNHDISKGPLRTYDMGEY